MALRDWNQVQYAQYGTPLPLSWISYFPTTGLLSVSSVRTPAGDDWPDYVVRIGATYIVESARD